MWRRYWKALRKRSAPTEVYKVDAHVGDISLWAGTIPYHDFVGNTYADAYAKAMAKRVQVHGAQRAHWFVTYKLAYQVMRRLLVIAQHAATADQKELQAALRRRSAASRWGRPSRRRLSIPSRPTAKRASTGTTTAATSGSTARIGSRPRR